MKSKILTGILIAIILISNGGCVAMHVKTEKLENIIKEKKVDLEKRSTEIANLEEVVKNKDFDLKANEMVIVEKDAEIKELKSEINNLDSKNKKLQSEISKSKYGNISQKANVYNSAKSITVNATAYIPFCREGCSGKTRSGYDVSKTIYYNGMRIIATDLSVIPMYSIVKIEGFNEKFIVLDTGGAIKGNKIDILFKSEKEANKFGRRNVKLQILKYGK